MADDLAASQPARCAGRQAPEQAIFVAARSVWHPARVEQWEYDGTTYQINSRYALPADASTYELTGLSDDDGTLAVVIPDATPDDGPFTPMNATHARVAAGGRPLPWPLLLRFVRLVEASGDIVSSPQAATVTGDLSLSLNSWRFAGRAFEVTSYHDSENDGWCYELYEVNPANTGNGYIDVRIPDLQPASGPFTPAAAAHVVFASHDNPIVPWPVLRHFLDAILASGDIVDDPA